jgi:hypothetical protein
MEQPSGLGDVNLGIQRVSRHFETSCAAGAPRRMPTVGGGQKILVAKSTFEGTFSFSQARKGVDIPHQEEKKALFCGLFPHFWTSPPGSTLVKEVH